MVKKLLLAAPLVSAVSAWSWYKSDSMCIGMHDTCTDIESCTSLAYGPCPGTSTEADAAHIHGKVIALALVKDQSAYVACDDPNTCPSLDVLSTSGTGFRDYDDLDQYTYMMTGTAIGDMTTSGAYVGMAGYLAKADIATNTNDVYVATKSNQTPVTRGASTGGAPAGPLKICIAEVADGACGADRVFSRGSFKFSIFAYSSGDSFALDSDVTHLGVRTEMAVVGKDVESVTLNGATALADIGDTDVTKLELELDGLGKIEIDFPDKYNYGDVPGATSADWDSHVPTGTKTVKIKVKKASDSSIYVDYLFDAADFREDDKYFMYDPPINVVPDAASTNAPTTAAAPTAAAPTNAFSAAGTVTAGLVSMAAIVAAVLIM